MELKPVKYIPPKTKIKLGWLSNDYKDVTGYAKVTREILKRLKATGKYYIFHII